MFFTSFCQINPEPLVIANIHHLIIETYLGVQIQDIPKSSEPLLNLATAEIKAMLVEKYRRSEYATMARTRIREISSIVSIRFSKLTAHS